AATGSKDLIPSKILLSYTPQTAVAAAPKTKPVTDDPGKKVANSDVDKTKVAGADSSKTKASTAESHKEKTEPKASHAGGSSKSKTSQAPTASTRHKRLPQQKIAVAGAQADQPDKPAASKPAPEDQEGVVTVVYNDPSGVLTLEVDLQH